MPPFNSPFPCPKVVGGNVGSFCKLVVNDFVSHCFVRKMASSVLVPVSSNATSSSLLYRFVLVRREVACDSPVDYVKALDRF